MEPSRPARLPAVIRIGTGGYSYREWRGVFYPEGLPQQEWLAYYAREFDFTELNTTFYRLPHPAMLRHMQARTPPGFRFFVKAFRGLTHERDRAHQHVGPFRQAMEALAEAGKLSGVLLQFPNSFRNTDSSRDYLRWLRRELPGLVLAVEFRHREWVEEEATFRLLEEEGLAYVCVDEPQFKGLVPPVVRVTARPAYVRLHGRNYRRWWQHEEPSERYDYLYSEAELRQWLPRLHSLERQAGTVFVSFNNHRGGQAVINGRMLRDLLAAQAAREGAGHEHAGSAARGAPPADPPGSDLPPRRGSGPGRPR